MIRTRHCKARNERIETGVFVKSQKGRKVSVERTTRECYQWKAKVLEKRTSVVSGTMKISVQNRHQKPLHPL